MKKIYFVLLIVISLLISNSALNAQIKGVRDAKNKVQEKKDQVEDAKDQIPQNKDLEKVKESAKKVRQETEKGVVDWSEQYIEARGMSAIDTSRFKVKAQAKLMARRGAIVDAQRNLLEIINGVRVVGETKVEDMIATKDYIYTRLDGVIKGAQMVGEPIEEDGIIMVTMRVPLYEADGLAPALLDDKTDAGDKTNIPDVTDNNIKPDDALIGESAFAFNLNGKSYDPALFPLIVDEQGNILADFTKIYNPKQGKFPQILNSSKDLLEAAGFKKGVDIIDVIAAEDGKLVVSTEMKDKFDWNKLLNTVSKVGKFLMLFV